jgi:hypothetical protein
MPNSPLLELPLRMLRNNLILTGPARRVSNSSLVADTALETTTTVVAQVIAQLWCTHSGLPYGHCGGSVDAVFYVKTSSLPVLVAPGRDTPDEHGL